MTANDNSSDCVLGEKSLFQFLSFDIYGNIETKNKLQHLKRTRTYTRAHTHTHTENIFIEDLQIIISPAVLLPVVGNLAQK